MNQFKTLFLQLEFKIRNMNKNITIIDKEYQKWIKDLSSRYRKSQIKAAVKVNQEMLAFYWSLGRDIVEMHVEDRWGESVVRNLSADLKKLNPEAHCFSKSNIYYMKKFYLYCVEIEHFVQQPIGQEDKQIVQQVVGQLRNDILSIPWGHHILIMSKVPGNPKKALFFIQQDLSNGWSRDMLLNFLSTDLYERQGKALNNFTALLHNITKFLIELGTGFAYVGKEYRLQIEDKEKSIDLLFYNLNLSCYVVIEVKIGEFDFQDAGQLGGYVVACNHLLRKEGRDNPTIGLLICKEKNKTLAQYALESSSQPIAISDYELSKLYPEKVEGTMPTIEELEAKLSVEDEGENSDSVNDDNKSE